MRNLELRIAKLESRHCGRIASCVIEFNPLLTDAKTAIRNVGKAGRYMVVPRYPSDAEWEAAARQQQLKLVASSSGKIRFRVDVSDVESQG